MNNHRRKITDEPRVFMTDDARHASPTYQMQPPLEPVDMSATIDQLARSGFDTISWGAGVEGGSMMYPSKVLPMWGEGVTMWTHSVWYRCWRNLRSLVDAGHDPFKVMTDRAHAKGIWFFANAWVNFNGSERAVSGGLGRTADWTYEHLHFKVGEEDDPRADERAVWRFNWLHDEVRQLRLEMFTEFLNYETDGVDLDLLSLTPFCRFDQVDELKPLMTQWMRNLRSAADAAEQVQGRKKRIWARIPHDPAAFDALGYDVQTWIKDGLVDGLICHAGTIHMGIEHTMDVSPVVELAEGSDCRVLVGQSNWLSRQVNQYATRQMFWAAAANAFAQGADGIGMCDAHWSPNGWPWQADDYHMGRILGDADLLATADKHYHARGDFGRPPVGDWLAGTEGRLPITLEKAKPVTVKLYIADDFPHWQQRGRLDSVVLAVRVTGIEAQYNELRVELNGQVLPDEILDLNDIGYRLFGRGAVGPYGFIYNFNLLPDHLPKQGINTITVSLMKQDPMIANPFDLFDVDCFVNYRLHRGFQRKVLEY